MRELPKALSYILHPIFIPLAGTLAYFVVTPRYSPIGAQGGSVLPIFILTVIIPIIAYLILRNLGLVKTVSLTTTKERKYALYIYTGLLLLVVYKVIPNNYTAELHFFFLGLIAGNLACLFLLYFNVRASMHAMGLGSLAMYLVTLSVHFETNVTIGLSIVVLLTGLVVSSRIYLKAHSPAEAWIGLLIGLISQLLTVKYWL